MGKLSTENLKFIAGHIEEIDRSRNGRGIYFCFDTIQNGEWAYSILTALYPGHDTSYGIDKRDFHVLFPSRNVREQEYETLSKEIKDYQAEHIEEIQQVYGSQGLDDPTGPDPDDDKKTIDWVAYIVVGAAAVVILLLLWDRKRK